MIKLIMTCFNNITFDLKYFPLVHKLFVLKNVESYN